MKFFIPGAEDDVQTNQIYQTIREQIGQTSPTELTRRRIFKLEYQNKGTGYISEIGKIDSRSGALTMAILESVGFYYVCTVTQGQLRDPIVVKAAEVFIIEDFYES